MAKHAYLVSPAAAVIAAVMGAALAGFPPTTTLGKVVWIASFALVGVCAVFGTFVDRKQLDQDQERRDKHQNALRVEVARLAKHDTERLLSTRKRARFLADEILRFLVDRNADQPVNDFYNLPEPEFTVRLESFLPKSSEYYQQTKELYKERFATEALEVTYELARNGVVDERLLSYSEHIDPPLVEQFAIRLREIGDQRD